LSIIQPPKPGDALSPEVRAIRAEGDQLAQRIAAMNAITGDPRFKQVSPLDAHLFTLQMEVMQSYLHVLTIRLARANDTANGVIPDTARALGKRPLQS
jgi:hypothetical protein